MAKEVIGVVDKQPKNKEPLEPRRLGSSQASEGELSPSRKVGRESLSGVHRSGLPSQDADATDFFRTLVPEMRHAKPNSDAIAAALEAVQRLAAQADAEQGAEDTSEGTPSAAGHDEAAGFCRACGYQNRGGNKFCGMCGLPVDMIEAAVEEPGEEQVEVRHAFASQESSDGALKGAYGAVEPPSGAHHYHHHYHHHYFPVAHEFASNRSPAGPSREADKLRLAAAGKGESMSRAEAAVRRLTQEWVLACNTRQLDDLLDLYGTDAVVLRPNLPPVRGAAAVREYFFSVVEAGFGEVEVEPVRVDVVGDMAYAAGRCAALVPSAVGKRREERGKYLWVFARQGDGNWKLAADCWASDLTLSAATESDTGNTPGTGLKANLPRKSA